MSDESQGTSVQEGLSEAADAAQEAVESNEEGSQEGQEQEASGEESNLESKLADPKASKATKEAVKKQLRKLKLKIDGQEEDMEYDPDDEDYMTKQFQLAKVAQKRMQEKSSIEKEVIKFIEDLKRNPKKALSDPAIGLDLKQLATQIIEEEIENSKKSPAQLEKEKLEAELRSIKEEREKEKEDAKAREFERIKEQAYDQYDQAMSAALEKSDLPKSPYVIKKMADYMLLGLQNGKDVKPEDVLPLVREEIQDDLKQMFAVMPDEVVEKLIGKDKLNSLRKRNIQKAKSVSPALKANTKIADTGKSKAPAKDDGEKQTFKDFFKM